MSKKIELSIPSPCHEQWKNFTKNQAGGFCNSCSKTVIDFTTLSDSEIINFIKGKPAHACGRFRTDQLKSYSIIPTVQCKPGFTLLKASLACLLLLTTNKSIIAQNKNSVDTELTVSSTQTTTRTSVKTLMNVTGKVTSAEDGSSLPGVNVVVKGTANGTITDSDGYFEIANINENDVLVFSFIGLVTEEYPLSKHKGNVDIAMKLEMDMEMMGAIMINEIYERPSPLKRFWMKFKSIFS